MTTTDPKLPDIDHPLPLDKATEDLRRSHAALQAAWARVEAARQEEKAALDGELAAQVAHSKARDELHRSVIEGGA